MSKIGRRIRVGIVGTLGVLISSVPLYAAASATTPSTFSDVETPDVIITEFQTNGGSAAQEFIELYNTTDEDISLDGTSAASDTGDEDGGSDVTPAAPQQWKLEFFNSSSVKNGTPVWSTAPTTSNSIPLTGVIPAHDYFLISSTDYAPGGVTSDITYGASSSHPMADTGGALQLLSIDATNNAIYTHDQVMWLATSGSTTLPEGVLASPTSGKSLQRVPNDDSEYVNDDSSLTEFGTSDLITPLEAWVPPVVVDSATTDDPTDDTVVAAPAVNDGLQPPQVTELLPNPASPLTDADDEFIELYNPNNAAFDLGGYKLEVGTSTLHSYTIPAGTVIAPLSYQPFYSKETGLSLSNSGGQVRFQDPAGTNLDETKTYGTAADNQAWIRDDSGWEWTTTATPGQPNVLAAPAAITKSAAKKTATTKKATTTKAKTTKAKTTKAKTTKKKKAAAKPTAAVATIDKPKPPIHIGILVGVAAAAVLYGLYEYRHDILLKFQQLRRDRRTGSQNRLTAAGQ